MKLYRRARVWGLPITLIILISLACSSLPDLPFQNKANLAPTRTPFPTFTPTSVVQAAIPILPTPTQTPIPPPPTDIPTSIPEAPPTDTPIPEAPPTDTPIPEATATAPPPPTQPPPDPPTETPPPAEPPGPVAQNGIVAKINFRDGRNTYGVGEKVFVTIEANNIDSGLKPFGILGLTPSAGTFQTSWDNGTIPAGETFRHEDGLAFPSAGAHKLWLSICFSTKEECQGPNGNWVRFEPGLDVIVQ